MSCDLLPTDVPGPHYQGDIRDVIGDGWDLMVAHPPCTYLTVAGLFRNKNNPERQALTEEGLDFVRFLMAAPISKIAIENPVSCISSRIRKPDQIIQPYQFGEDASKKTCFWLQNLPPLKVDPSARFGGRWVEQDGKLVERWSNQTDKGQNRLGPATDRWKKRSLTYLGVAEAMAINWG